MKSLVKHWISPRRKTGTEEEDIYMLDKDCSDEDLVDGEECAMKWHVQSGISAEQHQKEVMEEEKCGVEDKKEAIFASPCKDINLGVVTVHPFCSSSYVSLPVCGSVSVSHFVLCSLCSRLVRHTTFLPFLFRVASMCTTPGSDGLHNTYGFCCIPHRWRGRMKCTRVE